MSKSLVFHNELKIDIKNNSVFITSPEKYSFPIQYIDLIHFFSVPKTPLEFNKHSGRFNNPKKVLQIIFDLIQKKLLIYSGDQIARPKDSWHNHKIHKAMLDDTYRTGQYEKAIKSAVKGKTVIDIGCGTGILSLLAAKHGAKKVYAIDSNSTCCRYTEELAKENNFAKIIEVHNCKSTDFNIVEKADVIISELIGYHPFDEHIVSIFQDAQKRLLKPRGQLIPQQLDLHITPIFIEDKNNENQFTYTDISNWSGCYNLSFESLLKKDYLNLNSFLISQKQIDIITKYGETRCLDSITLGTEQNIIKVQTISHDSEYNFCILSFTAELDNSTLLETRPNEQSLNNHWKYPCYPIVDETILELDENKKFKIQNPKS